MARSQRRRSASRASTAGRSSGSEEAGPAFTRLGAIEYLDQNVMELRTFWGPLPTWVYGTVPALLAFLIAGGASAATGADGDGVLFAGALAALIAYFAGGVGWAVAGPMGGDVLRVRFNRKEDLAEVHQAALWLWKRDWDFDIDELESIEIVDRRSRLLLRAVSAYSVQLNFKDGDHEAMGRYPSYEEAFAIADGVHRFLDLPLRQAEFRRASRKR